MADFKGYRAHSQTNYGAYSESATLDQINTGSLQRIADATELMAKNHAALIAERDLYQRWYEQEIEKRHAAERRITALRGVITRMKRHSEGPRHE